MSMLILMYGCEAVGLMLKGLSSACNQSAKYAMSILSLCFAYAVFELVEKISNLEMTPCWTD